MAAVIIHHHSLLVTSMPKFLAFFFALSSGKERKKNVSKRSWRAGSREKKHRWGLSSEAVWLLLSVSSLAAFTTCRYTSLSSFNGRLRGDLSGAELLLSTGDSYDARAIHCKQCALLEDLQCSALAAWRRRAVSGVARGATSAERRESHIVFLYFFVSLVFPTRCFLPAGTFLMFFYLFR